MTIAQAGLCDETVGHSIVCICCQFSVPAGGFSSCKMLPACVWLAVVRLLQIFQLLPYVQCGSKLLASAHMHSGLRMHLPRWRTMLQCPQQQGGSQHSGDHRETPLLSCGIWSGPGRQRPADARCTIMLSMTCGQRYNESMQPPVTT